MATGVQEIKLAVRMQEWSARIAECQSSGMSVRAWCNERGISVQTYYRWEKRFVGKASQQLSLRSPAQASLLVRVNPETMPGEEVNTGEMLCCPHRRRWKSQTSMSSRRSSILVFPWQPAKAMPLSRWLSLPFTVGSDLWLRKSFIRHSYHFTENFEDRRQRITPPWRRSMAGSRLSCSPIFM